MPARLDFVPLEYHIAQKIIYEELRVLPVTRRGQPRGKIYNVNAGNYAVMEVAGGVVKSVECRLLKRDYVNWVITSRPHLIWEPLIPEEAQYGDNIRFV